MAEAEKREKSSANRIECLENMVALLEAHCAEAFTNFGGTLQKILEAASAHKKEADARLNELSASVSNLSAMVNRHQETCPPLEGQRGLSPRQVVPIWVSQQP